MNYFSCSIIGTSFSLLIQIVNQKMAPWHALLDKYDRALQTMESEERELSRIKQAKLMRMNKMYLNLFTDN